MRMFLPMVVLLMVSINSFAADPAKARIQGNYQAKGSYIDGRKYTAKVVITQEKETYLITWTYSDGQKYVGTGIRDNETLSVGWAGTTPDGKVVMVGVMVYTIQKSGRLEGKWTIIGSGGRTATETLSPIA